MSREDGFVVKLDNKKFLSGFSNDSFWPESSSSVLDSEVYDQFRTAKYAAELCEEKLNDEYDPEVKEITITLY